MIKIGITGASGILGTSLIYFLKKKPKYKIKKYNYDVLNVKKIENWIKIIPLRTYSLQKPTFDPTSRHSYSEHEHV